MEPIVFYIENYQISYSVDWLGIETIKVNDKIVSKKLSLPNRKHRFKLSINDQIQPFYLTSKQSFSTSTVDVSIYSNSILIEKRTLELYKQDNTLTDNQGSSYILGLVFVVLSLVFDWHKVFLFIGLVLLFYAFDIKSNTTTEDNSAKEHQDKSTNL